MSSFTVTSARDRIEIDRAWTWLQDTYWGRVTSRETFARAAANSLCVAVFEGDRQLGFGRVVTDYATFGWVSDVVVAPEARGRGIGRAIVAHMLAHPELQGLRRWNLNTRDAHGVYRPLGFTTVTDPGGYMERLDAGYAATLAPLR